MSYIYWFKDIGNSDLGLVGGKGANLGELTRARLPVPPGFCVTSEAYLDFLRQSGLDRLITDTLLEIHPEDLSELKRGSSLIQESICAAALLPEISAEVISSCEQLLQQTSPEVTLAVRSSATAEDQAGASFAGQLETYLNIRGSSSLLNHIKLCWASLWAERVISYIHTQELDHRTVSMAVVVQAMIPSEVAGVLFTVNPVNGNRDEAVINASWGLGEAVVSGLVTPDTIIASKSSGQVIDYQLGDKEYSVVYIPEGGTEEQPVPAVLRNQPCLSERRIYELTMLGSRIEAYFGKPQDIEWGFYQNKCYLLQSRPITTLAYPQVRRYPLGDFNRSMFIEIFPDPLSPVFLSVIDPLFKEMLDYTFQALGFEPPADMQAIGAFYNQPYFNRDYIAAAFQPLSPQVREPIIAQIVNPFGAQEESAAFELSLPYFRMIVKILRFMVRFPKQLPGLLATYRAQIARVSDFPYDTAADVEIYRHIYRLPFEYANRLLNNDFLMIAVIGRCYRVLGVLLKRHYQADTEEVVAKLISGVTGNVTMETNKRLWDLAQYARSEPFAGKVLRDNDSIQARMILTQSEVGRGFLQALDRFLEEFGHREVHMDILYPTWCEDPEPVFSFIRSYLDADEAQSPYYQQERLIHERQQLTRMVIQDMQKGILGRLLLAPFTKWFLAQTQVHTRERDTMHFEMTRLFPPIRRLALELGRRWAERRYLDEKEDVFFLTINELGELSETPRPMQDVVSARKRSFEILHHQPWPYQIRNGEEIFAAMVGTENVGESGLRGIAGSPGLATGVSRIIQGPGEFARLKKGEILIAPITNPVWTPLFAVAGAVVTEVGGILSHGAIVAREYGIPAVMSVAGATTLLKDGQRVTVDGNKGIVYLEGES